MSLHCHPADCTPWIFHIVVAALIVYMALRGNWYLLGSVTSRALCEVLGDVAADCLHHLLHVAKSTSYALRQVGHGLSLEHILSELHKKTFINRMIFSNCY